VSAVPSPRARLENPDAVLSRTDLGELGWPRRAVDAIFREAAKRSGVIVLPGYSRPVMLVSTYRAVLEDASYGLDRVWPG
jgi:hypothetical protein